MADAAHNGTNGRDPNALCNAVTGAAAGAGHCVATTVKQRHTRAASAALHAL